MITQTDIGLALEIRTDIDWALITQTDIGLALEIRTDIAWALITQTDIGLALEIRTDIAWALITQTDIGSLFLPPNLFDSPGPIYNWSRFGRLAFYKYFLRQQFEMHCAKMAILADLSIFVSGKSSIKLRVAKGGWTLVLS